MNDYVIFTDSACDIAPKLLEQWGIRYASLTYTFDGDDKTYINTDMTNEEFFGRMRQGGRPKTAAVNADAFASAFKPVLDEGKDILYVGFSSAISATVNSAHIAKEELVQQYPRRTIRIVDTLAASAGSGMMAYLASEKKKAGASLEENAAYLEALVPRLCIWFSVDDLEYLKRGGRVSPLVAMAGSVLGIKPVLMMDDTGSLVKATTVRGRKKAIEALADKYGELSCEEKNTPIFISHAEYEDAAKQLATLLKERYGAEVTLISQIGPVIGSHSGPGTLALFFIGKNR